MQIVETFFNVIFAWRQQRLKDILESFCSLEGYALTEEMCCYFSPEWQDYGLEYFGEDNVLFDFYAPAVDEDTQVIISYQEFFEITSKYYIEYANRHLEEKTEIMNLLEKLKNMLKLNS